MSALVAAPVVAAALMPVVVLTLTLVMTLVGRGTEADPGDPDSEPEASAPRVEAETNEEDADEPADTGPAVEEEPVDPGPAIEDAMRSALASAGFPALVVESEGSVVVLLGGVPDPAAREAALQAASAVLAAEPEPERWELVDRLTVG